MKCYARLFANVEAYHSGATYFEELFLPLEVYKKLQKLSNYEQPVEELTINGIDGKHSEVTGGVLVSYMSEDDLKKHTFLLNDGEQLLMRVLEGFASDYDEDEIDEVGLTQFFADGEKLEQLQDSLRQLQEIETVTFTIKKKDIKEVLHVLKNYIV